MNRPNFDDVQIVSENITQDKRFLVPYGFCLEISDYEDKLLIDFENPSLQQNSTPYRIMVTDATASSFYSVATTSML